MEIATAPTLTPESHHRSGARYANVPLACVILLMFFVYIPTLRYEFVYDDFSQIQFNPNIQSWSHLPKLFQEHVWVQKQDSQPQYYRPVFMVWCLLQFKLFGLQRIFWHLGAVLLHLVVTAMVFRLAMKLLADDLAAVTAALLFGLHPVHLESVAWVSGETDPLMAIFFIASWFAYLGFRESRRSLALSVLLYGVACLAKETAIVLPALIAVYEWMLAADTAPAARLRRTALVVLPYAAIGGLYLVQRWAVLHAIGSVQLALPLYKVPLSWPAILWFYVTDLAWPVNLALFHGMRPVYDATWDRFWQPLLLVWMVGAAVGVFIRRLPAESNATRPSLRAAAWISVAWFVIPLLPVLDILLLERDELVHDRYLYLPCVGFALLVAIAVRQLRAGSARLFGWPALQFACAALLASGMALATQLQSGYWSNELLLYTRAMQVAPNSLPAATLLADTLLARNHPEKAIAVYQQILGTYPTHWQSHFQLGKAYFQLGRYPQSETEFAAAVRLSPAAPFILVYLANAQIQNEHYAAAEDTVRRAIAAEPFTLGEHYVLGLVLEKRGRWNEAADAFRQELALDANQPVVREELARAERQGR